jgi:hypothetical protein
MNTLNARHVLANGFQRKAGLPCATSHIPRLQDALAGKIAAFWR